MIKLSNGHNLEYLASSGALAYNGRGYWWEQPLRWTQLLDTSLFVPITKTLTYLPNEGYCKKLNPFSCIRFVEGGVLNAVGLGNPGIDWWVKNVKNFNGIISISYEDEYTLRSILKRIEDIDIIAIELNISCPNIKNDFECNNIEYLLKIAKSYSKFPIIIKLGYNHKIEELFPQIEKYIDAISINSIPWNIIYPNIKSPFEELGGGALSGKIVQPYTWNFIKQLKNVTDVPIIGCSVWEYEDIEKLYNLGVCAISFGSIFLRYPWRPTQFIRKRTKNNKKIRDKEKYKNGDI